ncbi:MAG: nucleotidyltransferase domain-containing protein [Pseudanabaena sp.]
MARGEASEDSDIDILVVLRDLVLPMSEIRRMADIKLDFLLEFGELLSIMPMSLDEFNDNSASLSVYGGEDVNQSDVFTKHFWGYGSKIRASQGLNPNLTEFFNPLN